MRHGLPRLGRFRAGSTTGFPKGTIIPQKPQPDERQKFLCQKFLEEPTHIVSLWVAKTSAGTKNGALLGKASLNTITASIQQQDSGGHEPECAWSVHIYIKDRRKVGPG